MVNCSQTFTDLRQEIDVRQKPSSLPNSGATTPTNPQSVECRLQGSLNNNNNTKLPGGVAKVEANGTVNHVDQGGNTTPNKGMALFLKLI